MSHVPLKISWRGHCPIHIKFQRDLFSYYWMYKTFKPCVWLLIWAVVFILHIFEAKGIWNVVNQHGQTKKFNYSNTIGLPLNPCICRAYYSMCVMIAYRSSGGCAWRSAWHRPKALKDTWFPFLPWQWSSSFYCNVTFWVAAAHPITSNNRK